EADGRIDDAHRLEQRGHADRRGTDDVDRLLPRPRDERRSGEVVDLARPDLAEQALERGLVGEIHVAATEGGHLVATVAQQLDEIRAVLARGAGDDRTR